MEGSNFNPKCSYVVSSTAKRRVTGVLAVTNALDAISNLKFLDNARKATEHFRAAPATNAITNSPTRTSLLVSIAPKLSKEMFQANGANERGGVQNLLDSPLKRRGSARRGSISVLR